MSNPRIGKEKGKEVVRDRDEEIVTSPSPESDSDGQTPKSLLGGTRRMRVHTHPAKKTLATPSFTPEAARKTNEPANVLNLSAPVNTRTGDTPPFLNRGTHSAETSLRKRVLSPTNSFQSKELIDKEMDKHSPATTRTNSGTMSGSVSNESMSPSMSGSMTPISSGELSTPGTPISALRVENLAPNYARMRQRFEELAAQGFEQFKERPYGEDVPLDPSKPVLSDMIPATTDFSSYARIRLAMNILGPKSAVLFRKGGLWYRIPFKELLAINDVLPTPEPFGNEKAIFVTVKSALPNGDLVRDTRVYFPTLKPKTNEDNGSHNDLLAKNSEYSQLLSKIGAGELWFGWDGQLIITPQSGGSMALVNNEYNVDCDQNTARLFEVPYLEEGQEIGPRQFVPFKDIAKVPAAMARLGIRDSRLSSLNTAVLPATSSKQDEVKLSQQSDSFGTMITSSVPAGTIEVISNGSKVADQPSTSGSAVVSTESSFVDPNEGDINLAIALSRSSLSSRSSDVSPEGKPTSSNEGRPRRNSFNPPKDTSQQELEVPLFPVIRRGSFNPDKEKDVSSVLYSRTAKLKSKINSGEAKAAKLELASNENALFNKQRNAELAEMRKFISSLKFGAKQDPLNDKDPSNDQGSSSSKGPSNK